MLSRPTFRIAVLCSPLVLVLAGAARQVMSIRSPGRDGRFSSTDYTVTSFEPGDFDEDIVWTDGFFIRWPQAKGK